MNYIHNVEYLEQVVPVRYMLDTEFFDFNPVETWDRVQHARWPHGDGPIYWHPLYPWHQYVYTPSLRFNGGYYGDPSDDSMYVFNTYDDWYARVRHVIDSLLAVPSPIRVDLLENYQDVDSVYLTFDIVAEDVIPDTLKLYVAATESLYRYPFPTGRHFHSFRDFAVDSGGYDLIMTMGDSVRYNWSWPIDPEYRIDRLVSNIWIEDPDTKEVLQALRDFVPEVLSGVEVADIPDMRLHRNTPNPFSTRTSISYSMRAAGKVHLAVYSLDGRLVKELEDSYLEPGLHKTDWDGRDRHGNEVASGVYYYRIETEQASHAGKMIVLR